jgi:hypothetical protein
MPAAIQARSADDVSDRSAKSARRKPDAAKQASSNGSGKSKTGGGPLQWIRSLLKKPVKLKRIGMQLHVVLESRLSVLPESSKSSGRGEALRIAHAALQRLLDQHGDARAMFPHLNHVEQALARTGSRALITTPIKVLQRAMDQLDNLEGAAREDDLMTLRLRVEESIKRRSPMATRDDVSSIEVTDASHSQFDEADRHWTGRVPLDAAPTPARAVGGAK